MPAANYKLRQLPVRELSRKSNKYAGRDIPSDVEDDSTGLQPGPGRESFKLAEFWKTQVNAYEEYNARWYTRGNKVLKRYRDERSKLETQGMRRMNLLWANIKIMKPAIYSRCPDPIVERKFLDKDPTGRLSSVILERTIVSQMEHGFHTSMTRAVYDRLLPGRGQIWFRYEPEFGEEEKEIQDKASSLPAGNINAIEDSLVKIAEEFDDEGILEETPEEEEIEETGDTLLAEKVITDYINWRDFYIFPATARTWDEVQAIGKRVYMSKQECRERFGKKIADAMRPDTQPLDSKNDRVNITDTTQFQDINERSIVAFEIWNKSDKRVYWISTGYDYLADVREDPYKLKKFFPVPEPLSATLTNDTLTPVPDYYEYQDQAIQIDELTQRIAMLTKACKVAGAYNASQKALSRIFEETTENQLIPVDQWAMFAQNGGVKGAIEFIPIDQIQSTIQTLQEVRQQCMQDLDQITGISDVVRGTTDSRETLGGIRLKNNNAGTRLSESQEDVSRFARDGIAIIGELAAKHFSDETLVECSGILFDEEMQPDAILREFEPVASGFSPPQQPNQPQPGAPPAPQAQQPPQQPGMPPTGPPAPQNNVIPFPQAQQTPPVDPEVIIMQKLEKALGLLRKDVTRFYRMNIETDSTIFGDKVQERQDATDFTAAIGQFMASFEKIAVSTPEAMPLLGRTLQWAARKYRIGRDLEAEINSFVSRMEKKAKQVIANPPPNPEQIKANNQKEIEQMKANIAAQADMRDHQRQEADDMRQHELQKNNDERDAAKQAAEDQRAAQMAQLEYSLKEKESQMELQKMHYQAEYARLEHEYKVRELELKAKADKENREEKARQQKAKTAQVKKGGSNA